MTETVASRRQYAPLGRRTLRLRQGGIQGGGQGVLLRLIWPRLWKNHPDLRKSYLPAVTLGGKKVPVEWGNWLYVTAVPGEVQVRAVQGGRSENAADFDAPEPLSHSVAVAEGEAGECEYFPTVAVGGGRRSAGIPRMRSRIRLWDRSFALRSLVYGLCFFGPLFGLIELGRILNDK